MKTKQSKHKHDMRDSIRAVAQCQICRAAFDAEPLGLRPPWAWAEGWPERDAIAFRKAQGLLSSKAHIKRLQEDRRGLTLAEREAYGWEMFPDTWGPSWRISDPSQE